MADSDSALTPEQKLLRVIEDPPTEKASGPRGGPSMLSLFSISALKGRFAYFKDKFKKGGSDSESEGGGAASGLKKLNLGLKFAGSLLALAFVANLAHEAYSLDSAYNSYAEIPQQRMADIAIESERVFSADFFEELDEKNVFIPVASRVEEAPKTGGAMLNLQMLELTQNLRLVGISVSPEGAEKTFCMLEDLKKDMTSFVRVGDTVMGMKVAEIREDSILLEYGGEQIELR